MDNPSTVPWQAPKGGGGGGQQEEERGRKGEVSSVWAMHPLGQYGDQGSTMQYTSAVSQLQPSRKPQPTALSTKPAVSAKWHRLLSTVTRTPNSGKR